MIKTLFFPEKIGNTYFLKKIIVGVVISEYSVSATKILINKNTFKVVDFFFENISKDKQSFFEKLFFIMQNIKKQMKYWDDFNIVIMQQSFFLKEYHAPFKEKQKIAIILPFEMESLLPVPLHEIYFDFFINKNILGQSDSYCVIIGLQKKYIDEYTSVLDKLPIPYNSLTLDFVVIYGLYRLTSYYKKEKQILVINENHLVHVLYLEDDCIKVVRSLCLENINDVFSFTLQSFCQEYGMAQTIVFVKKDKHLEEIVQKTIGIDSYCVDSVRIIKELNIDIDSSLDQNKISLTHIAAVYPSLGNTDFSLATENTLKQEQSFIKKEASIVIVFIGIIFAAMMSHTIFQIFQFSSYLNTSKEKIFKDLKQNFNQIKSHNIKEALRVAKKIVTKEEEVWLSFSSQTRHSFLQSLYQLTTTIDKEMLDLQMKKMVFTKDSLYIEGSVKNFEALALFEQQLKDTNLFLKIPGFQKTEFAETLLLKVE